MVQRIALFFGKVDLEHIGVSGHSQGGVGAINAATDVTHASMIKAVFAASPPVPDLAKDLEWDYDTIKITVPTLLCMMFFEQQFDKMEKTGMSVKENLGWSSTFMKEGLAFLLLLLYRGNAYPVGMSAMLSRSMSACGFTKEAFYFGTGEADDKTDIEVFTGILANWKDTVDLSEKEVDKWLKKLDIWIRRRVCGIMDANRRNYYGECAGFIAAFGEVQESLGETGAKARIMEQYRREYSRRRAFHEELRRYGMRK